MEPQGPAGGTPPGRWKPVPPNDLGHSRGDPRAGLSRAAPPTVRARARHVSADPVPTDEELIRAVLAGDRERFHELVHRHAAPLWSTIRRSLRDREEARDVLQETWARALEGLPDLREPGRLRAWLVSIAQNLVRERGRRPRPLSVEAHLAEAPAALDPGPSDCETRDAVAAVRDEIEKLPPRQREVFDLRMNHELSHAEIARLLGITEESSRANHYQALRRLRARFPEEGSP